MELTQLRYFRTVARLENVTKASRELHITQPNLSSSIARLEQSLGVPLFFHRRGQIKLTPYGKVFLEHIDKSFQELETGVRKVQELYEINQGEILVATSINDLLPDLLKAFSSINPNTHIKQFNYSMEQIAESLMSHRIQFAITSESIVQEKIEWVPMVRTEKIVLLSRNHRLAGKGCVSLKDLASERFICDTTRADEKFIRATCGKAGFVPNIACETNDNKLVLDLVEAGFGVAFISGAALMRIKEKFPGMAIAPACLAEPVEPASIGIARLRKHHFSLATREFYNYVSAYLTGIDVATREFLRATFGPPGEVCPGGPK